MAEVAQYEIKADIILSHVGRHCILHALTVIEAAISQFVRPSVCSFCDCVCVRVCVCKCPDFPGQLYDKAAPFGTITKCVDYAGVLIFKCPH